MTRAEIINEIRDIIADISPDEDLSVLGEEDVIREKLDLDSMDFLDIMMELRKRHKINVPEPEYAHFITLAGSANYLQARFEDKPLPELPPQAIARMKAAASENASQLQ